MNRILYLLLFVFAFTCSSFTAQAALFKFLGTVDTHYSNPENWAMGGGFPGIPDPLIGVGDIVVIEAPCELLPGETITNDGTLVVKDDFEVHASASIVNHSSITITTGVLDIKGTLPNLGGTIENMSALDCIGTITNENGTIKNKATGTLSLGSGGTIDNVSFGFSTATIENSGTLAIGSGGTISNEEESVITNGFGGSGTLSIGPGGTLINKESSTDLGTPGIIDNLMGGLLDLDSGTLTNKGGITIEEGSTFSLLFTTMSSEGNILNKGLISIGMSAILVMEDMSYLTNGLVGGTGAGKVLVEGSGELKLATGGTFSNNAFFHVKPGGFMKIDGIFHNVDSTAISGEVEVKTGGLMKNAEAGEIFIVEAGGKVFVRLAGTIENYSLFEIAPGGFLENWGSLINGLYGSVNVGGAFKNEDGSTISNEDQWALTGAGTLDNLLGAVLTNTDSMSISGTAALVNVGIFTNSGAASILVNENTFTNHLGGTTSNGGTIVNQLGGTIFSNDVLSIITNTGVVLNKAAAKINNKGTWNNESGSSLSNIGILHVQSNTGADKFWHKAGASLTNTGTITVEDEMTIDGSFLNEGALNVNDGGDCTISSSFDNNTADGIITVAFGGLVSLISGLTLTNKADSETNINGGWSICTTCTVDNKADSWFENLATGYLLIDGLLINQIASTFTQEGTLAGTGAINHLDTDPAKVLSNDGVVVPGQSPGIFTVNGDYSAGTLNIELGGSTPGTEHDQLVINGSATISGPLTTLNVTLINGFIPNAGTQYVVLKATSLSGSYTTVNLPDTMANNNWVAVKQGNNIVIKQQSVVPVNLTSFAAEAIDQAARMTWATAAEVNTAHFELERSPNGTQWEVIHYTPTIGGPDQSAEYDYLDEKAFINRSAGGEVYYRLKMVDWDGKYDYSSIEVVLFESISESTKIQVYPNPSPGQFFVQHIDEVTWTQGTVSDAQGARIGVIDPRNQANPTLDLSHLPDGKYYLTLYTTAGIPQVATLLKFSN